jgi:hypothetical protein
MAIARSIEFVSIDDLSLDPLNPRLGRRDTGRDVSQELVLELMRDWKLDELAVSFLENGFWPNEALVVVQEELYGSVQNVVVEGNRRLAALILLRNARAGNPLSRKWADIAASGEIAEVVFSDIPIVRADTRGDVEAFLGYRHVTGIKEWDPAEKAEFIARLIDRDGLTYQQVMRKIGSKVEPVRRNYISYRILLQLEDLEGVSVENIEERFSVLFLSLREPPVQSFLGVDVQADPENAQSPIPTEKLDDLASFSFWLFGTPDQPPLFSDSREMKRFSQILASPDAVSYLKDAKRPNFEIAWQKAGSDEPEIIERIQTATDELEQALGRVHLYTKSEDLQKVVVRFGRDALELLKKFPTIWDVLMLPPGDE